MSRTSAERPRPEWLTVPNALTVLRIALTPFFGYFWWRHQFMLAIVTFVVASLSDLADGLLARLLDQKSALGQLLDPAADKFLVLVTFIAAAATGAVPWWLAALVIGRDLVLAAGGLLFAFVFPGIHDPDTWKPTRIGKYATFYTVLTIGLALVRAISESEALRPFVGAFGIMSAVLTTISGLQYVVAGVRGFVDDRRNHAQGGAA